MFVQLNTVAPVVSLLFSVDPRGFKVHRRLARAEDGRQSKVTGAEFVLSCVNDADD